jgi:hypothetical protein
MGSMVLWRQQACLASLRNLSNSGVMQEYQLPSATSAKAWGTGFMALSGDVIEVTKGQIISYCIVTEI